MKITFFDNNPQYFILMNWFDKTFVPEGFSLSQVSWKKNLNKHYIITSTKWTKLELTHLQNLDLDTAPTYLIEIYVQFSISFDTRIQLHEFTRLICFFFSFAQQTSFSSISAQNASPTQAAPPATQQPVLPPGHFLGRALNEDDSDDVSLQAFLPFFLLGSMNYVSHMYVVSLMQNRFQLALWPA